MAFYPCKIWGGPPQNTLVLSRGLQRRGHEVHILTSNILDYEHRIKANSFTGDWQGLPVTYLKTHWRGRRADSLGFIWSPDLLRYHHLVRWADVVHIQDYRYFLGIGSALMAQVSGKPYLVQPRGSLPSQMGRSRLKRVFDQSLGALILRRAASTVALSDTEVEQLRGRGVRQTRIAQIFNPLDPELCSVLPERDEFRRQHRIGDDERVILFLSRLHPKKGLDLLLEAVAQLPLDNWRLCVVGPDDGFEAAARQMAANLGVSERVMFVGPLYDRDKFAAYRAADVYVLPSRGQEGLPTTLVEAAYAGVPSVVTRTVEIARLIDGVAGLAVDYDRDQLAGAIHKLLSNSALHDTLRNGTQRLLREHFDLETALNKFESVYRTVVERKLLKG
jgi:glycosyltransferase involved in cell wall biosynthesis